MQIHILALLFFFQTLTACQQDQGKNQPAAASLAFLSVSDCQKGTEKALPTPASIVFQSVDAGQTWQDLSDGLPVYFEAGRVYADNNEIYLASEEGLYHRSTSIVAPMWVKEDLLGDKITDIYPGQSGMYASSYGKGFYKGIPGTGIWKSMHDALDDKTVRTVLEASDGAVFVGCESGIYKSVDGGNSWKQVYNKGGVNNLTASGDVLLCGTYTGLQRSTDGGEHWEQVLTDDGSAYKTKRIEGGFITITGGGAWQDNNPNKLYTSADEGKTWQSIDAGLPLIRDIYDVAQAGKYIFCSTDAGISRSADGGKTWEFVRVRANEKEMFNLAVSGQMVFAVKVFGC